MLGVECWIRSRSGAEKVCLSGKVSQAHNCRPLIPLSCGVKRRGAFTSPVAAIGL